MFNNPYDIHMLRSVMNVDECQAWEGCVLEFGDVSIVWVDSNLVGDEELYFLTPVSIPKMHHIIRLALAIIMNISNRRISIYVKHAAFHGVSRCHRRTRACISR